MSEGRERGCGSWWGAATPSPSAKESGERCELSQRGLGRSPDRPKVFHYFQHSGWPLLTLILLTVDYHAAIGGKTPVPPPLPSAPARCAWRPRPEDNTVSISCSSSRIWEPRQVSTSTLQHGVHVHRIDYRSRRLRNFLGANDCPRVGKLGRCWRSVTADSVQLLWVEGGASVQRRTLGVVLQRTVHRDRVGRSERRQSGRTDAQPGSATAAVPVLPQWRSGRLEREWSPWRGGGVDGRAMMGWRCKTTTTSSMKQSVAERATVAVRHDVVQDWIHRRTHVVQYSCPCSHHTRSVAYAPLSRWLAKFN